MEQTMGRNLYILAGSFGLIAVVAFVLSVTHLGQIAQSSGDESLWRTTGIAFVCLALVAALAGVLSSLFEQAERRHEQQRRKARDARKR